MDILSVIVIAVALAMDAFSVSISAGIIIKEPGPGHYFRLAFHFGLFQGVMPVLGYAGGMYLVDYISAYDHWIAFFLLAFIGIKMIRESFSENDDEKAHRDPSRGMRLVVLAVATSIDALAVGFSLGILNSPIFVPSIIIGVTCALFSAAGIAIGSRASRYLGRWGEVLGGSVLIIIGIKILADHIL